ncbi:prepilin-type N-terminal cleavage/methylation domain-containing protein [Microcoleus vaginatus]|uniref:prepilin-type N-terminal cleavage/methylation domain-containing protein n=1 Tax=Microcoleus vaginatus TaxID=119532 RepID=UPI0016827C03|nr:prepilin-type N-terminal cleavage/methylation domain-containing protein [Microcoleus sp. FACHB-84]
MKTPILLKVLQISATKANPNYKNTASRKGDQGFTLLEVLVIALIVGILSSIAAPSWEAFINRQRVRTVNDRVLQTLRTAQSEAKRTKSSVTVTFNYDPNASPAIDPPTVTFNNITQELNGGGEIKPRTIALTVNKPPASTTPANSIVFDYQGNLTPDTTPFFVTVAPSGGGTKQCVIVQTLLGGMRTDEGTVCP